MFSILESECEINHLPPFNLLADKLLISRGLAELWDVYVEIM